MDDPVKFASWPVAAGLAALPLAFAIGWLAARLGVAIALRRLRRADGAGWVERARLAFPARLVVRGDLLLVPLSVGAIVGFQVAPGLRLAPVAWGVLAGLAAQLGVLVVGHRLERRLCWSPPDRAASRSGITVYSLLLQPVLVPFVLMLAALPSRWGWGTAAVLASGVAIATFHACGGWLVPLRWLGLVRPASPRLAGVVARAADRARICPRATLELASPQANALAWPVPRVLILIGPILDVLDDDELASVVVHELGHLDEPRSSFLVRLASAYLPAGCVACVAATVSLGAWAGLIGLGAIVIMIVVARRLGRRMEERSDRMGRDHEGEDAGTYARALEAIYRANLMPAVLRGKRAIHPHLYDRLIASGVTPDYPRPEPPPRIGLAALPALALVVAAYVAVLIGLDAPRREAYALEARALALLKAGDRENAARLLRRAEALDQNNPHHAANLALVLVAQGRTAEAEAAARRAEARLGQNSEGDRVVAARLAKVRASLRRLPSDAGQARSTPGDAPVP